MPLGPFHFEKFQKIFRVHLELWGQTIILVPNWPIYYNMVLFWKSHFFFFWKTIKFHAFFWPLLFYSITKKNTVGPELWSQAISPKWYFSFRKTIKLIFMYLLPFSSCKVSKKPLVWVLSLEEMPFSGQNCPLASNENFFRKTSNIISMYLLTTVVLSLCKISKCRSKVMSIHHF